MDLVERLYWITGTFPAEETYGLASQMRRASVSIPSNIAEGHTRAHSKEFLNHLSMAQVRSPNCRPSWRSLAGLSTFRQVSLRRLKRIKQKEREIPTVRIRSPPTPNPQPLIPNP
ncbi:MAG TPA: four helix bundle protein [Terriglobia bacterium]|nr:four helix bundle protein [Terriglobia bacterium]